MVNFYFIVFCYHVTIYCNHSYYSLFCLSAFCGLYQEYPQFYCTKWEFVPFVSF